MSAAPTAPQPPFTLPLAEMFFSAAITGGALAHGYVLKGKNTSALYQLALSLAQALNCASPPPLGAAAPQALSALACGQCKDCRWIVKNAHPAVLTLSRLTYQVNEKGELMTPEDLEKQAKKASAPTQIKTDQIGRLIQQLGVSSEACRVVIFTDVEERPASQASTVPPPYEWQCLEANGEKSFHIRPLDRSAFHPYAVNKFLKTLEEPPPKTLFLFLTETEEQLLDTIVSRCQVIPCVASDSTKEEAPSLTPSYQTFIAMIHQQAREGTDVYRLVTEFERLFIEEEGLSRVQALAGLQHSFRHWYLKEHFDAANFARYRTIQQEVAQTIGRLEAKTNESASLLNLFIRLSQQLKIEPLAV